MKKSNFKWMAIICSGLLVLTGQLSAKPIKSTHAVRKTISKKKTDLSDMKIKNIEFGFNKAAIPEGSYPQLDKVAKLMTDNNAALKLGGYADNKGGYVYNWMLSKSRAQSVKSYLVSKGADSTRIAATEYGYTKPIASNKTKEGRRRNRRVEIHFAE